MTIFKWNNVGINKVIEVSEKIIDCIVLLIKVNLYSELWYVGY